MRSSVTLTLAACGAILLAAAPAQAQQMTFCIHNTSHSVLDIRAVFSGGPGGQQVLPLAVGPGQRRCMEPTNATSMRYEVSRPSPGGAMILSCVGNVSADDAGSAKTAWLKVWPYGLKLFCHLN